MTENVYTIVKFVKMVYTFSIGKHSFNRISRFYFLLLNKKRLKIVHILPSHGTWAPVILNVSFGLVLLFKPVNAAVNTVGYDSENPMSVRRNIVTTLAII